MTKVFEFNINGFKINAVYDEQTINDIFLPMLKTWTEIYKKENRRIVVFLSAPPGVGKTTLSQFLEYLSHDEMFEDVQALGLDGFHYHQEYILSHNACVDGKTVPMKDVKGCLETFDIEKLLSKLQDIRTKDIKWPIYDRNIHDVIEDAVTVKKNIVLIEGNWLLSTEGKWAQLIDMCDDSIFIYADREVLKERLISRKVMGGTSRESAERFYYNSDSKNIDRLLLHHHRASTELIMQDNGIYTRK